MGNHHSKKRNKSNYIEKLSSYNVEKKEEYEEDEHIIHVLYREVFKKNFSSPVKDILSDPNTRVLDIGCGSGFWLIEMAADFPKPKYVGIDVAPVFPKSTYPSNIEFFQHNFLEGLPYEDNTFDFVHMQGLVFDITKTQWENFVYQELARVLKPGGWLEICDPQVGMINPGPTLKKLQDALCDHFLSNHVDPFLPLRHHLLLKSVPLFSSSTVYHENGVLPVGSYAGNFGKLGGRHIRIFSKNAYQSKIGRNMNVKQKDIESNLDIIEREFDIYKSYFNVHRYYVQKMAEDESYSVKMKYPSKFR